jgi:uncharacterized membrane protein YeaQ/YmgE (transglycosylase-associated protein family)
MDSQVQRYVLLAIFGILAGWIAGMIVGHPRGGVIGSMIAGLLGSVVGSILFSTLGIRLPSVGNGYVDRSKGTRQFRSAAGDGIPRDQNCLIGAWFNRIRNAVSAGLHTTARIYARRHRHDRA